MLAELRGQLAAALGIVDQLLVRTRCFDCGRTARELVAWPDGDGTVWLGPSCHRRRQTAAERGASVQLPIAGGSDG